MRGVVHDINGIHVVDDTYNASPDSITSNLHALFDYPGNGRRIAVLADVLELGKDSGKLHEGIGQFIIEEQNKGRRLDYLFTVGKEAAHISDYVKAHSDIPVFSAESKDEVMKELETKLQKEDWVLVKVVYKRQLFSRRGYNIDSLTVGETENPAFSRMTVSVTGDDIVLEQIEKQVNKLEDVKSVKQLTGEASVCRELILVKVEADKDARPAINAIVDIFQMCIRDRVHLGNVPMFFAAAFFGKRVGAICGGVGMALSLSLIHI